MAAASLAISTSNRLTGGFRTRHPADGGAVAIAIGLTWFGLLAGFIPDILDNLARHHSYVLAAHVHAASAVGWMALLTWQATLVRRGRVAEHRRNGRRLGYVLAAVVALSAVATVWSADRAAFAIGKPNLPRLSFQLVHVVQFVVLTGLALARIDRPDLHKRLLLLGAFAIVDTGWSRWLGPEFKVLLGDGLAGQVLGRYPLIWALMLGMGVHDLRTRGRLHPVWLPAVGFILVTQCLSLWLYFAPWWPGVARAMLGV